MQRCRGLLEVRQQQQLQLVPTAAAPAAAAAVRPPAELELELQLCLPTGIRHESCSTETSAQHWTELDKTARL